MKIILRNIIVLFIFLYLTNTGIANASQGNIPSMITKALKTGNTDELSYFLNQNLELVILNRETRCSKKEAINKINNFFTTYVPNNFIILHEGGKSAYHYAIGTLNTSKGKFRVYFLLKKGKGQEYIQQLRIERSNE